MVTVGSFDRGLSQHLSDSFGAPAKSNIWAWQPQTGSDYKTLEMMARLTRQSPQAK